MKPKVILIVLLVALAISGIILYFIKKNADAKKAVLQPGATTGSNTANNSGAAVTPTTPVSNSDYPIIYNTYSEAAKPIQEALGVTQDGYLGPKSLNELGKYWVGVTTKFAIYNEAARDALVNKIKAAKQQNAYFDLSSAAM
ncbi:hypothetical protein ACFOW1_09515 [Parasediminibacterium paludis]|uniref:Uncharacterized protein n=1 Tax=Parasediminibacterium paludis TaxID=908966 RepID=A0ABV8PW34_9BACT